MIRAIALAMLPLVSPLATSAGGDAAVGEAIARQWCSACHATEATDAATDGAPAWRTVATDLTKDEAYLGAFLANPHGQMQHLELTNLQIANLIAYIRTLGFE